LNLQCCHNMIFLGIGDSYETYYQAIRRCYRFGQTHPVTVKIVVSEAETEIVRNVQRKEAEASRMASDLMDHVVDIEREEIGVQERERVEVVRDFAHGEKWALHKGDCIEVMPEIPDNSVDLSVYSPPFLALYTYTNSERDIGNCSSREEFLDHFGYVVRELLRVTKPGRLTCCHISQVTSTQASDGVIGLKNLKGAVVDLFIKEGWIYHGDVTIDKDPQAQAIRTHSKALLFVQLRKDASWLRPALADYIAVFRKPGENAVPIHPDITNEDWIEWARPIWYNIRESDTLNVREARANYDDRHVCPLQLGTIERCVRLWSNPGETVFSPFAGIGSEGYQAILNGRKFLGVELKPEYFKAATNNLTHAEESVTAQGELAL
jgi:DNA modification methylase